MTEMIKKIKMNKMIFIFLAIVCLFFPSAISKASESESRAVVMGLGLDFTTEYEISAQVIIPQNNANFNSELKVYSASGESAADALEKLSLKIGKRIGLAHCSMIAISDKFLEKDLGKEIDVFYRGLKIGRNSLLINTNEDAKKLLEETAKQHNESGINFDSLLKFNENKLISAESTLQSFLNEYYSQSGLSLISVVNLVEEESEEGGSGDSGGSTGGGSTTDAEASKKYEIENSGETAILKNGVKILTLSSDEMKSLKWIIGGDNGVLKIENVIDDKLGLDDATLNIRIEKRDVYFNYSLDNGFPSVRAQMVIDIDLDSVENGDQEQVQDASKNYFSDTVKSEIKAEIASQVAEGLNLIKAEKIDLYKFYKGFYKFKYDDLKNSKYYENAELFAEDLNLFLTIFINEN